jgi:hypothetical protein
MAAAWPLVVSRLVAYLPTLPGWSGVTVVDGQPLSADYPGDFVTVGYSTGEDFGGAYEQTYTGGGLLDEAGTVRSELVCQTGDVDLPGMRARAFALVDAWQAWVSSTANLGLGITLSAALSVDVQPIQNTAGTAQRLTVTLSYSAIS